MILIISSVEDVHVSPVTRHLDRLGVAHCIIDPARQPDKSFLEARAGRGRYRAGISGSAKEDRAFSKATAIWHRRPTSPGQIPDPFLPSIARYVSSNRRAVYVGSMNQLPGSWLPARPAVQDKAGNKVYHLSVATALGFVVPLTRITTDPQALPEMFSRSRTGIIIKSLMPFVDERNGNLVFTQAVNRRDLRRYRGLRHSPMIVQERVHKRTELRITVVGEEVFAAEIDSQASPRTLVDFRHGSHQIEHRVHQLPAAEARRCVELTKNLGLCFGAIDMILTPQGKYVFLEINPNGQWLWIENTTGMPIAAAVAQLLIRLSKSGRAV